jgi:hypothetical protein
MKRIVLMVAVVIAGAMAVDELSDLTQSRPDPVNDAAVTELVVAVEEDRFGTGIDGAADALWAVCAAQTSSLVAGGAGLDRIDDGRYRAVLEPAVGHHEEKKLVGCLEDLTVDRVMGDVESFRTVERRAG